MARESLSNLPYRRLYFDVEPSIHAKIVKLAKAAGITQKAYLQKLVEADAAKPAKK